MQVKKGASVKLPLPAFTIICFFVALMIVGLAVIPLLSVQLEPTRELRSISVSYRWNNVSAEMVEQAVTVQLEGSLASVKGIKNIRSTSRKGSGFVQADLDDRANMNEVRYEVSTMIRQLYPGLPAGVSFPILSASNVSASSTILSYTVNGPGNASDILGFAEQNIKPKLAQLPGVAEVNITGAGNFIWRLYYQPASFQKYHITNEDVRAAVNAYFSKLEAGKIDMGNQGASGGQDEYNYLTVRAHSFTDTVRWEDIPIKAVGERIVYLTDVVKPVHEVQAQSSYYRINGRNTVNMQVVADRASNYIVIADRVKHEVTSMADKYKSSYKVVLNNDTTELIKKELRTVMIRGLVTVCLLLAFVFLIGRWQINYVLIVAISIISSLLLAFIAYAYFNLEIHLYSLAAISVSIGMVVNNTVVIVDHLRYGKRVNISLALLGATLAIIGAVSIVFFLDKAQQVKLYDFAMVIMINLTTSLITSLFLIPSLLQRIPLKQKPWSGFGLEKRRIIILNKTYIKLISVCARYKKGVIAGMVLTFGLPVFLLPQKIETAHETKWTNMYNATIGSDFYNWQIRPWADKALGGTLRLFIAGGQQFSRADSEKQTKLTVNMRMPAGATLAQMNDLVQGFEQYLGRFRQIKQFNAIVGSGQSAKIEVLFDEATGRTDFPETLKSAIEERAMDIGLAEFDIYGIGEGFSNALNVQSANAGLTLLGYNYNDLHIYAEKVSDMLKQNLRVDKVSIASRSEREGGVNNFEFLFKIDQPDKLLMQRGTGWGINQSIRELSNNFEQITTIVQNGNNIPVSLVSTDPTASVWELLNNPIPTDSGAYRRLNEFASIHKERTGNEIVREDQQYQLVVNYNFVGEEYVSSMLATEVIDEISKTLPIGYTIKPSEPSFWKADKKTLIWAVIFTIAIVFIICSILLNSVGQAIGIILIIPISYIGVFLASHFFNYQFDEGGYVAFIILCGIVVNAALYVVNTYNTLKAAHPLKHRTRVYLQAFNAQIVPALFGTISIMISVAPFIIFSKGESFWYPLSLSIAGGLAFSIIALVIFLPVLLLGFGSSIDNEQPKQL